jgi:hypothetical protein
MESKNDLPQIISSLPTKDKAIINSLHETALALGYMAKISPVGKKSDDWKCEYIAIKPNGISYFQSLLGVVVSLMASPEIVEPAAEQASTQRNDGVGAIDAPEHT